MKFKDDYVRMRKTGKYQIDWFFDYFLENGGKQLDIHSFSSLFQMLELSEVLKFLDFKFSLTRLEDSKGNFIKIVEH